MAKGNLLLGLGSGKLGDIVLSRTNGQQITRVRVRKIKNPRTTPQQIQRLIIASVSRAYSGMKAIVNHSFQGYAYGAANMNRFNKLNADLVRNRLASFGVDPTGTEDWTATDFPATYTDPTSVNPNGPAINNWIISEGTLPQVPFESVNGDWPDEASQGLRIKIANEGAALTYKQVIDALGLQPGDQLTVCAIDHNNSFHYGRFILSPIDGDNTASVTDSTKFNERNLNITPTVSNGYLVLTLADIAAYQPRPGETPNAITAAGLILSRKTGETWQRSTSRMQVWMDDWGSKAISYQTALELAEAGQLNLASPYYLNNANTYTAAEGDGENP